jgi:hypothetical protein
MGLGMIRDDDVELRCQDARIDCTSDAMGGFPDCRPVGKPDQEGPRECDHDEASFITFGECFIHEIC